VAELRAETALGLGRLEARLGQRLAEVQGALRAEIAASGAGLMKWMFYYWAGSVAATIGVVLAAAAIFRR